MFRRVGGSLLSEILPWASRGRDRGWHSSASRGGCCGGGFGDFFWLLLVGAAGSENTGVRGRVQSPAHLWCAASVPEQSAQGLLLIPCTDLPQPFL